MKAKKTVMVVHPSDLERHPELKQRDDVVVSKPIPITNEDDDFWCEVRPRLAAKGEHPGGDYALVPFAAGKCVSFNPHYETAGEASDAKDAQNERARSRTPAPRRLRADDTTNGQEH